MAPFAPLPFDFLRTFSFCSPYLFLLPPPLSCATNHDFCFRFCACAKPVTRARTRLPFRPALARAERNQARAAQPS